jgi:DNA-directed RNA polymerase subunit M/transcription elongation factor TFIIS
VRDATAQAEAEADDLTRQMNGRHDGQIAAWAKFISGDPTRQKGVREADAEVLARVRAAAVTAALEDRLADDILTAANLEAEQKKLNEMTSEAVWWSAGYAGARVAVACVLGLVVAAPFWIARRRTAAEKRKSAQTCPRCLETGKLKVLKTDPKGKGEYKESTFVECKACEYRIARSHQQIARLCFPTVGIRASGKTHMLTTAYSAIKSGTTPTRAAVKTAPSVMDERFRQYIDLILRHRGEAGATVHDAEHLDPLLIHVRDTDRWGPSGVLVNLFDYSGELLEQTPLAESLGPRAMLMDGFMLFFDPTQIYGDTGVNLQDQVQALNDFYERMATERGLDPGTIIPNPVAVCITKFDLLETHNPIGGMCLDMIQQLDGPLKPGDGEAVTLAMLKARSDLVEQMLPLMLPGVDLRRLVREHFGTQMMFFPMSSVNLNLDEFGRVDPADRNPAPYGVVEPILWLLHMHGYRVLDAN